MTCYLFSEWLNILLRPVFQNQRCGRHNLWALPLGLGSCNLIGSLLGIVIRCNLGRISRSTVFWGNSSKQLPTWCTLFLWLSRKQVPESKNKYIKSVMYISGMTNFWIFNHCLTRTEGVEQLHCSPIVSQHVLVQYYVFYHKCYPN